MPFTSGVAANTSLLMKALSDHLVTNGWTKLRGEEDMACASPKAARYWRLLVTDKTSTSGSTYVGMRQLQMRTTVGGTNVATNPANYTLRNPLNSTYTASNLINDVSPYMRTPTGDANFRAEYDFGTPTVIREIVIRGFTSTNNCPKDIHVQWSNDGRTWTTMFEAFGLSWTASETKTFTFGDGYVAPLHISGTEPTRAGGNLYELTNSYSFVLSASWSNQCSDDIWAFQGPGLDASRRVYLQYRAHRMLNRNCSHIEFICSPSYDSNAFNWKDQVGGPTRSRSHVMGLTNINYWIYSNSKRVILITRSGLTDFTSSYNGMFSAFATPEQYSFPLLMSGTCAFADDMTQNRWNTPYRLDDVDNGLNSMADPGDIGLDLGAAAVFRDFLNNWREILNRRAGGQVIGRYQNTPGVWIWPYHLGATQQSSSSFPSSFVPAPSATILTHFLDRIIPSTQGDVPMFPCTIFTHEWGAVGALDGVFAVPGAGIASPLQVITVGGQDYRLFPTRDYRNGSSWFAVRED